MSECVVMFGLFRRQPGWQDVRDPNLRLAILGAAWTQGLLARFDRDAFYRDVLREEWRLERQGSSPDERTRAAILAVVPPVDVLRAVRKIDWGGGEEIQHVVFHYWDGEDDLFDVRDLSGIGVCEALRDLHLGCAAVVDIGPLVGLAQLESFKLNYGGYSALVRGDEVELGVPRPTECIRDLRPLLDLPALAHLDIGAHFVDDARNRDVLRKLKQRGVALCTPEAARAQILADAQQSRRREDVERGLAAFKEKRHAEVVERLGPHEVTLSPSEHLKLQYSRKQIAGAPGSS